ncbi:citrate/2-methylcitrate synthase, partial [Rhizobium johnstonii]|uniref:citrate/2-methylcitrate synthase n=1 Tax=Rhizobium johnstonii TaxID=3019933 RepID=UPI003F9E36FB
ALAEAVEVAALAILNARKPNRPLYVNVEFYTALLLEALGFPREAFTGQDLRQDRQVRRPLCQARARRTDRLGNNLRFRGR